MQFRLNYFCSSHAFLLFAVGLMFIASIYDMANAIKYDSTRHFAANDKKIHRLVRVVGQFESPKIFVMSKEVLNDVQIHGLHVPYL